MSAPATTQITVDAGSDVGRSRRGRPNEDSIGTFAEYCSDESRLAAKGKLFVVADGMGGAAGGKEASSIAIRAVFRAYYDDADPAIEASLERAFQAGNSAVQQHGRANPELRGLGTTIAAAVVRGQTLVVGNVGDSRAYVLRGGELRQVSLDHTMVQEQVREGVLLPDEAALHPRRHVLSRNLGYRPRAQADFATWTLLNDDTILLCSDGLWGPVGDDDLAALLQKKRGKHAVKALIELANERGGPDNISAIVVHIDGVVAGPGSVTTEPVAQDGSVTTEPGTLRPVPPLVPRAAAKPGAAVTEPIEPRAGAIPGEALVAAPRVATTAPVPAARTSAAPPAAPASGPSAAGPSRTRRLLPLVLLAAVVLLGSALLYRTLGSTSTSVAALGGAVASSPAQAGPSPSAKVSPGGAASASSRPAVLEQAVSAAATSAPSPAPSSAPRSAPSPPPAAAAELSSFEVPAFPNSLALSPDGATLAIGSDDGSIQLLRAGDGSFIAGVQAHDTAVAGLAFSPNSEFLASAADQQVILWRVGSASDTTAPEPGIAPQAEVIRAAGQLFPDQLFAIGLDGQQLLFAGKQGEQIKLWRDADEQPFATLDGLGDAVQSVVFAPDGQSLAVIEAGKAELRRATSDAEAGTLAGLPTDAMWSVAFVPGRQSVVLGFPDSHVERRSYTLDGAPAGATAQASARGAGLPAPLAEPQKVLQLGNHDSTIVTVVFRDPQTLLSASLDGEIRQWSLGDVLQSPPADASPPASGAGE